MKSVVENIKLPPTLLSRFDLIYLILDKVDEGEDRRLAKHLVGLYSADADESNDDDDEKKKEEEGGEEDGGKIQAVDKSLLKDYVLYAKMNIHPVLSDAASSKLIDGYLQMRRGGDSGNNSGTKTVAATPRQLESLIRLSTAQARMRLSNVVTANDVKEAIRLMRVATQAAATDPRTGRIDMDLIVGGGSMDTNPSTGAGNNSRARVQGVEAAVRAALSQKKGTRLSMSDLRKMVRRPGESKRSALISSYY